MTKITSILLVANPYAGRFRKATLNQVSAFYRTKGIYVKEILDLSVFPASNIFRKRWDAALVMGGDGTVNRLVNTFSPGAVPIGIIPTGTGNVFARELGIPLKDPLKAASVVMRNHRRAVDLGYIDGRYFLLMTGVGFDGEVASILKWKQKRAFGIWAYVLAAIKTFLKFKPTTVRVETEVGTWHGVGVLLCNTQRYGGPFCFIREARIDDGYLDVIIFKKMDMINILRYLLMATGFSMGKLRKNYLCFRASRINVYSDPAVGVQMDGDYFGSTPISVSVLPRCQEFFSPGQQSRYLCIPNSCALL